MTNMLFLSMSMFMYFLSETSTSTDVPNHYDNLPSENHGFYHVSYHQALKSAWKPLERWQCALESGNYFIPLLSPYRQHSLLVYCLDREAFLCYDSQATAHAASVIKWRGERPSAVYWYDELNMLFIASKTHMMILLNINGFKFEFPSNKRCPGPIRKVSRVVQSIYRVVAESINYCTLTGPKQIAAKSLVRSSIIKSNGINRRSELVIQ
jgi:hypothetical protein